MLVTSWASLALLDDSKGSALPYLDCSNISMSVTLFLGDHVIA